MNIENKIDKLAKIIWNYLLIRQKLQKADIVLVFSSIDLRVAGYAAELYKRKWAPLILFSGGLQRRKDLLASNWEKTEAEKFAEVAIKKGVPKEKTILEKRALNSGENILFSYELLKKKKIKFDKVILVQKPYMARRAMATFLQQWPDKKTKLIITAPNIPFSDYASNKKIKENFINIMVGDLQRIMIYPKVGYQIEQKVPLKVINAYQGLIFLGYTKHLLEYVDKSICNK
jgi:uncharacterized SAM-binding protein YcdF (DUF218 family)